MGEMFVYVEWNLVGVAWITDGTDGIDCTDGSINLDNDCVTMR